MRLTRLLHCTTPAAGSRTVVARVTRVLPTFGYAIASEEVKSAHDAPTPAASSGTTPADRGYYYTFVINGNAHGGPTNDAAAWSASSINAEAAVPFSMKDVSEGTYVECLVDGTDQGATNPPGADGTHLVLPSRSLTATSSSVRVLKQATSADQQQQDATSTPGHDEVLLPQHLTERRWAAAERQLWMDKWEADAAADVYERQKYLKEQQQRREEQEKAAQPTTFFKQQSDVKSAATATVHEHTNGKAQAPAAVSAGTPSAAGGKSRTATLQRRETKKATASPLNVAKTSIIKKKKSASPALSQKSNKKNKFAVKKFKAALLKRKLVQKKKKSAVTANKKKTTFKKGAKKQVKMPANIKRKLASKLKKRGTA